MWLDIECLSEAGTRADDSQIASFAIASSATHHNANVALANLHRAEIGYCMSRLALGLQHVARSEGLHH